MHEASEKVALNVLRGGGTAGSTELVWSVRAVGVGADAASDILSATGTLVFQNGESDKLIFVHVDNDAVPEEDELLLQLIEVRARALAVATMDGDMHVWFPSIVSGGICAGRGVG